MRGRTLILVGILAALVAAVLIIFNKAVTTERIVDIGGVIFVGAGLVNLLFFNNGTGASRAMTSICNAAAIIFGVCMLVFRSTFEPLIPFAFGLLIAICAVWQFYALAIGIRPRMLPAWLYIFPLLLAAPAIYIFLSDNVSDNHISIITGVALAVFGVAAIIEGCMLLAIPSDEKTEEKKEKKEEKKEEKKDDTDDGSADLDEPAEPEKKKETARPQQAPKSEAAQTGETALSQQSENADGDTDLDDEV